MSERLAQLFDDLEREARERSWSLEALGKLPSGFTAQHYPLTTRERIELRRLKAAAALAPDADVFVALCRGEAVPIERVDARLARAHQRRTGRR